MKVKYCQVLCSGTLRIVGMITSLGKERDQIQLPGTGK